MAQRELGGGLKKLDRDRKFPLGESKGLSSSNCYIAIANLITDQTASPRTLHFFINSLNKIHVLCPQQRKTPKSAVSEGLTLCNFWRWRSSISKDCQHFCEHGFKLRLADKHFPGAIQAHSDTSNPAFCTVCIRIETLQMLDLKIPRVKGLLYWLAVGIPSEVAPHPETSHLSHCLQAGTVRNSGHLSNSGSKCTRSAALQPTLKLLG